MSDQSVVLKSKTPPPDNTDLRGFSVPTLFRRARGFVSIASASYADAARHCLYVIEGGLWRDPEKYGREIEDPEFNFAALKSLSDREVCWEVIRLDLNTAKNIRDLAQLIGWDKVRCLTVPAVLRTVKSLEHAPLIASHVQEGAPFTEADVDEILKPLRQLPIKRGKIPLIEDDRKAYEKHIAELQLRCRRAEKRVKELEKKLKDAVDNLRAARDEIGELQSKLFAK